MATKPLSSNAIARFALTEKKVNMTLDDIIKMSKKSNFKVKKQRASNKSQKFLNAGSNKGNASKVRRFMDSRSSVRQGVLAQRRSNFQGNQFSLAIEAAKKAAAAPVHARARRSNFQGNQFPLATEAAAAPVRARARRSNFQGNQFPLAAEAAAATVRARARSSNFQGNQFPLAAEAAAAPVRARARRSNFQGNQFSLATEAAKKAPAAPVRNRMLNWNKPRIGAPPAQWRFSPRGFCGKQQAKVVPKLRHRTLDSLFANMKEQRMKALSHQMRRGRFQQNQQKRG